ncbi:hypothetical protein F2Q69_00058391 [Brassica cretica]|uniref:Uncharacterized protein n=1 Tax=Brassica cretica TaxID=69181 RepID=A0A8S9RG42_BRACR|nr:hypothetical protein F2Q69_00058391 [Brassica cretica]
MIFVAISCGNSLKIISSFHSVPGFVIRSLTRMFRLSECWREAASQFVAVMSNAASRSSPRSTPFQDLSSGH